MDAKNGGSCLQQVFACHVGGRLSSLGKESETLAETTGITTARIGKIIAGTAKKITLREMAQIASALETPLDKLLDG